MSVKITPEQLADIESKANATLSRPGTWGFQGASAIHAFQSAANPAVVLAMSKEIKRLWAAQCWVIAAIDTDKAAFGPFFEKNDAEYRMDSMPTEFAKKHKIRLCKGGE